MTCSSSQTGRVNLFCSPGPAVSANLAPVAAAPSPFPRPDMSTFAKLFAGPEYGKVVILDGGMGTTLQVRTECWFRCSAN